MSLESSLTRRCMAYLKARPSSVTIKLMGGPMVSSGQPDIIHIERGRVWGIELKVGSNKTTAIQDHRLSQWLAAGATAAVVRSLDDLRDLMND